MSKKIRRVFAFTLLLGLSLLLLNCGSSSSRPAAVLYVLSQGEAIVQSYAINLDNGKLSQINTKATTDTTPSSILLDASGKAAFVLNTGSNTITAYTANDNGSLSAPSSMALPVKNSVAMARDAAGTFLIVVSQGAIPAPGTAPQPGVAPCPHPEPDTDCPAVTVFTMQSGSPMLTQVGDPVALDRVPTSVTPSVTGTFDDPDHPGGSVSGTLVQITSNQDLNGVNDNTVSEYVVPSSGAITSKLAGSPYTVGSDPGAVLAVKTTPVGGSGSLFVYVANSGSGAGGNSLSVFLVCTVTSATCTTDDVNHATMVPVGVSVSVGLAPVAMTVDPTNTFLFVVNHGSATVSGFKINATTGLLSALNPATASTGSGPMAISMHSSGKFLFVSNNASSNISGFTVDTTSGKMSTAINVTSDAQPAGLAAK